MTLETWLSLNQRPGESRRDAVRRYAEEEQQFDSPADKQGFIDYNTDYKIGTLSPTEYAQQSFDPSLVPTFDTPSPQEQAYVQDPDLWDSLKRGTDLAQASWYGFGEGPVAGFLDDIGLEDASASLKDWAREGRLEQEAEAAQIAPAKSIKQELEEDPDSWYQYLDPDMMTMGQMAESAPTSLSPWLAAVPLALATPYILKGAGIAALGTMGSKLISAGVGMGAGNLASSAIVSSEAYERGKSDPIIRKQMGIDPDKRFEDLLPEDQQIIDKVATDLSQTSFGHRLYTAGLVEMASYIPYGHAMLRLALDTGLGTASEVWDRVLYSEDAVEALIENGVPREKAPELRQAILDAGPSFRQVLISAAQQEFVMGGTATTIESLIGQKDNRVNKQATASRVLNEEVKRASELKYESDQKQLEYDRKVQLDREKQLLKSQAQERFLDQKAWEQQQAEQLKANNKELLEQIKHANKLEEKALADQAIEYDLEDTTAFYDEEGNLTADFYGSDTALRSAQEIESSLNQNLPVSVEDLNLYNEVINQRMADLKKGSDLERQAKQRQADIKAKIKELTEAEAAQDTTEARLKRKQAIEKEETTLKNMEKRIFGVKGENASRFGWPAEKFVQYRAWKKRKLALEQRKELENTKLRTQEQIERRKKLHKKEIEKQAADLVDQTIKPSAIQSEGAVGLDSDFIQKYVDDLGSRHEKYKGIYTVLNKDSVPDLANILIKERHKNAKGKVLSLEEATAVAEKLLSENNAWVMGDHVYVNADNIKGETRKEALENLVKIVTFHEPITHLGLKQFLGADYVPFLDNFFNTNKNDIQNWAENEALTDQGEAAYLGGMDFNDLSESQQRDLAEEFLANKFVELGILDPDIVTKTADALVSALKGVLDPLNKRISTTQARSVLAEVQRSYLGGKKNIITGDFFDPANWTMKGIEVAEGDEDKLTAYRRYLDEQGIEYTPATFKEPETIKAEVFKEKPYEVPVQASKRVMTPRQAEIWKAKNKIGKGRRKRFPELVALAKKLETGKASYEEYQKKADELLPIKRFSSVPKAATDEEILGSIDKGQYRDGLILGEDSLTKKDVVNVRLDIPAYERYDSWIATITHGGKSIYGAAVRLKDVTFKAPLMGALRIAQGKEKTTLATMKGTWQENSVADIEKMAKDYINDPAWVQIGYNPERQSSFYIREDKNGETKGTPLESADEIIQVGAFILAKNPVTKDTPSYTTREGVTFKFSKKTLTPMQRKVYSLLKPTEKSIAYTKTAKNRPEEKQKRPTAKLQKFTLPKRANGKSPVIYVGGGKSTDNWKEQVESVLSKSQIKDAIQWYPRVMNAFIKEFGKDRAPNMMLAWALANKAESPLGAMRNVLRAKENLADSIHPDLRKKGGLNDEVITKILKDEEVSKGSGVKLYDFVDAMLKMDSRNWTGFDPAMGAPAVVDRHTWRDRGWTDNTIINYIKSQLPKNKRAKKLEADKPNPTVTPIEYEETASWLRDITSDLNSEKWMGRSNWTPDQTQAVGWMAVTEILQIPGGTSESVLAETGRSVAFETFWGEDSPFRNRYEPSFKQLTKEQQVEFLYDISDKVADIAIERTGVTEKGRVKGWGFWENTPMNPNMIINVSATDQGMANLMDTIGLLAQQDSVVAFGPKHNAVGVGIDVYDKNGKFSDPELLDKVYRGLLKASPWDKGGVIQGASQTTVKGVPALRIILANTKAKGKKVADKIANNKLLQKQKKLELKPHMVQLANDLDLDIMVESFQAQMFDTSNDWKGEHPNGELYRRRIDQNFRPTVSRRIQDRDATTIENEIQKRFDEFGIKYSKRVDSRGTGRKTQGAYKGRLDVESDGLTHLVHWSTKSDLKETDPTFYGTGIKGAERINKKYYPELWVDRTYFGLAGYRKEADLLPNMYETSIDPNNLYDIIKDPDGFGEKAYIEVPATQGYSYTYEGGEFKKYLRGPISPALQTAVEKYIKDAGYEGYFNRTANVATLYYPKEINFVRKDIRNQVEYIPSIRVMASKAFHGSAERFDRFSTDKVRTGEGHTAYGWGLYFTTIKEIAKHYKDQVSAAKVLKLSDKELQGYWKKGNIIDVDLNKALYFQVRELVSNLAEQHGITMKQYTATKLGVNQGQFVEEPRIKVLDTLSDPNLKFLRVQEVAKKDGYNLWDKKMYKKGELMNKSFTIDSFIPDADSYAKVTGKKPPATATLYEVELAPKDHEYLKYDLPLKEQSVTVKAVIHKAIADARKTGFPYDYRAVAYRHPFYAGYNIKAADATGADFYRWMANKFAYTNLTKKEREAGTRSRKQQIESEKKASLYLHSQGVRGIKYYTGETRNKQKKDYNYVIFDEADVSITAKYSKRLATEQELEAEWRANVKADVAPPPPPKKDKVTISPEARVKASDIAPKEIMNPDGNIKTSKILASRAAHHAISTRDTGKKKPLRYRVAEKLTRRLVAQGTLPDAEKYKALRRIASGTIVKAEEAGRKLYDVLKKTKQPTAIYRYFTEKDFNASNIRNPVERKAAVEAKAKIQKIGVDLVGMGLMDEGARLQYEGQYLPQMYLKYLIPDDAVIKVKGGGIRIDAGYLKKRKDIPEGVKRLILGEIKDPAYLATRATTVPVKDMAIINWLQQIAANPNWVLPSTLVEFDMLGEMKKKALDLGIQKQLELKDTKGVKISAHWLANEAQRMFNQTKYMPNLTKEEFKIIQDVTTKMENLAKEVNDNVNVDPSQYSTVPKTAKYGMLGGMAVRKEIANDIFGGMNMTTGDLSMAESIFGDGGAIGDYQRLWKWAKVSANPPSWVRNFVSNMILMNMGGVSWYKMPGLIVSSLKDMRKMGKHKGALHQLTKDLGLTSGNFSNVELGRIEREFKDLQIRLNKKGAGPMGVLGMIKGAFNKVRDVTSDTYGGIDSLGKMMMMKNELNKAKMKVKDLADYTPAERAKLDDMALNAEKWLFDYSNPLPSVKWLRRAPFGAPFISFTSFVAPLMLETAITKPWKFLPYYALGYAAKEWFKEVNDLDEEKYEGLKVSMSEYLREKAYSSVFPAGVVPWPYLDENGRVQFQDISYLFPWGMFSEMGGEIAEGKFFDAMKTAGLMGGPTLNVASAIMTGIDPFTRQPIVDPTGDFTEQAADVMWHVFNLTMPPMFHGIGQGPNQGYGAVKRLIEAYTGQLTKEGEARFTKTQAWLRMFGQNVTPIAVPEGRNKQLRYEYSQLMKLERLAKRDLRNSVIMQESEKEIKKKFNAYRDKIIKARNELQKKINISTPPMSLLRQREEALRKMRQRLQQQRAS